MSAASRHVFVAKQFLQHCLRAFKPSCLLGGIILLHKIIRLLNPLTKWLLQNEPTEAKGRVTGTQVVYNINLSQVAQHGPCKPL